MSRIITFRCPPALDDALSAIAASDGVPLGDVIRQRLGASFGIAAASHFGHGNTQRPRGT